MKPPFLSRVLHFVQNKAGLFNQSYRQNLFGREFIIPSINGRKSYGSEIWMADLVAWLLPLKSGAFIDVGANLGQTLLKVAAIDPGRRYLGFEPNPTCADYLFELIRRNRLHHVVVPAGLGARTQVLKLNLYREEGTDPSASLVENFRERSVGSRPVVVIGWSDLPAELCPHQVALVKIDVEGGEKEVMEGLRNLLIDQRPAVLLEVLPPHTAENRSRIERQHSIEKLLSDIDYLIFRVRKGAGDTLAGIDEVDGFGIHADLSLSDYLLLHRDEAHLVEDLRKRHG